MLTTYDDDGKAVNHPVVVRIINFFEENSEFPRTLWGARNPPNDEEFDTIFETTKREHRITTEETTEEYEHRMKQEPQDEYCGSDDCSEPVPNVERRTVEVSWGDIHMCKLLYKCDQCEKSYTQSSDLTYHIREVHNAWKRYKCDQCGKSFNRNAWLKAHIRTHTGEKPYKCDQCDKSFKSNRCLKEHRRAHTNERPYKCDQCDKSYSTKSYLKVHKRSHTGEKP